MEKVNLICLPYAGGAASVFYQWKEFLSSNINLHPIELAGRGRRIKESLYTSIEHAASDVYLLIKDLMHEPYAFYGHSLGSMIVFELAQNLLGQGDENLKHIFFSGRPAPHLLKTAKEDAFHNLPLEKFKDKICKLGGINDDFFNTPDLANLLLPMMYNDFKISELYTCRTDWQPFQNGITVFMGKFEKSNAEQMFAWKQYTLGTCTIRYYDGDHFFINQNMSDIVGYINYILCGDPTGK